MKGILIIYFCKQILEYKNAINVPMAIHLLVNFKITFEIQPLWFHGNGDDTSALQ